MYILLTLTPCYSLFSFLFLFFSFLFSILNNKSCYTQNFLFFFLTTLEKVEKLLLEVKKKNNDVIVNFHFVIIIW